VIIMTRCTLNAERLLLNALYFFTLLFNYQRSKTTSRTSYYCNLGLRLDAAKASYFKVTKVVSD